MQPLNIHPLIVHFPIAFLFLYSILELIRFRGLNSHTFWLFSKSLTSILGAIGAVVASMAGELAEERFRGSEQLKYVEIHSTFATATTVLAVIVAVIYAITWLKTTELPGRLFKIDIIGKIWNLLLQIHRIVYRPPIMILLALALLVVLSVTGAIGGGIVYGPENDPLTKIIYQFIQ